MNADDGPGDDTHGDESGSVDESDAVAAFERLGLTSYQAQVFIALQRLGTGTARDVARVADVPRSQVYSAAEELEERGLVSVQRASPIRYRPVDVDTAREILRDRFEREQSRAFDYVESVRREAEGDERQEDIWTVRDRSRVDERTVELCERASDRLVVGARLPGLVTDEIEAAIAGRAADGVDVTAISSSAMLRDRLGGLEGVDARAPAHTGDDRSGRVVVGDQDAILLSVVDGDGHETAIWSTESLFAAVLIQLIEASTAHAGEES